MLKDDAGTKLSRHELSVACLLLNSADYCLDTISALEQKLVEKADPEFKDRIGKSLLFFVSILLDAELGPNGHRGDAPHFTALQLYNSDLSSERDLFGTVITSAIGLLVQDMEYSCHAALQAMLKSNWSSVDKVTEKSGYIIALIKHIEEQIPIVRDNLSSARKYYTQFCIKFASLDSKI